MQADDVTPGSTHLKLFHSASFLFVARVARSRGTVQVLRRGYQVISCGDGNREPDARSLMSEQEASIDSLVATNEGTS